VGGADDLLNGVERRNSASFLLDTHFNFPGSRISGHPQYVAFKGKQGEPCDMPEARQLLDDVREWERAADDAGRHRAWEKIPQTNADQVFTIGTVNGIRQPIVVGPKIRNVPKEAFYAWNPGAAISGSISLIRSGSRLSSPATHHLTIMPSLMSAMRPSVQCWRDRAGRVAPRWLEAALMRRAKATPPPKNSADRMVDAEQ
jgi:hypothetical protein